MTPWHERELAPEAACTTMQDSHCGRERHSHHVQVVVDNLRTQLKDATKSFKDVLTLRTENLKVSCGVVADASLFAFSALFVCRMCRPHVASAAASPQASRPVRA